MITVSCIHLHLKWCRVGPCTFLPKFQCELNHDNKSLSQIIAIDGGGGGRWWGLRCDSRTSMVLVLTSHHTLLGPLPTSASLRPCTLLYLIKSTLGQVLTSVGVLHHQPWAFFLLVSETDNKASADQRLNRERKRRGVCKLCISDWCCLGVPCFLSWLCFWKSMPYVAYMSCDFY